GRGALRQGGDPSRMSEERRRLEVDEHRKHAGDVVDAPFVRPGRLALDAKVAVEDVRILDRAEQSLLLLDEHLDQVRVEVSTSAALRKRDRGRSTPALVRDLDDVA